MTTRPASVGGDGVACAVACPDLAERLRARFGGGISVRAPGDPVAAIALCGVESFVGRPFPERRAGRDLTVVMARAPGEALEAALLAGGADDVIDEARSDALILARLHALARRHRRSHAARVACGPWLIDFEGEEARAGDGRRVRLTRLEARLLRFLADRESAPVPPHVLLARVFGYNERVETHTLETHVYRLRRKLEEEPGRPRLILRGEEGYRLALEPSVREAEQGDVTTATGQPASASSIGSRDPRSDRRVGASPRQPCTRP